MKLKIPYFKQEKNTTCGVACMRMVFAFYGKNVSESELEEACETSWLGNTCSELVQGAIEEEKEVAPCHRKGKVISIAITKMHNISEIRIVEGNI